MGPVSNVPHADTVSLERPARRRWKRFAVVLVACGLIAGLAAAGLAALRLDWPATKIEPAGTALARVVLAPFGERVGTAAVVLKSGRWVDASIHNGVVEPSAKLAPGSHVKLEVTVRRAGWLGWVLGSTERVQTVVAIPSARLTRELYYPKPGRGVDVLFSKPVAAVSVQVGSGMRRLMRVTPRRRWVSLGVVVAGNTLAGAALVSGTPRLWERMPKPIKISWFPAGPAAELLAHPAPAKRLDPLTPIVLTFSRPLGAVLGTRRPPIWPVTPGSWHEPNDRTLVFEPSGTGFPLGVRVHLGLRRLFRVLDGADPVSARTLTWRVPSGSPLRLTQLLAELGYLPLAFRASAAGVSLTPTAQVAAALAPPRGRFDWRYPPPLALRQLWESSAERPVVIQGALMAFESARGLALDGDPSPALWRALLGDRLATRSATAGYSYVYVSEGAPETLTLWHDGRLILETPANTGIPQAPTALGTYPVYLHLVSTTMSGINPDGTPYSDPGVPWVNYFNGGDAVHGFIRPGYGYPQSLGCVEVPISTAAAIFPYVQVGTLVTVAA